MILNTPKEMAIRKLKRFHIAECGAISTHAEMLRQRVARPKIRDFNLIDLQAYAQSIENEQWRAIA